MPSTRFAEMTNKPHSIWFSVANTMCHPDAAIAAWQRIVARKRNEFALTRGVAGLFCLALFLLGSVSAFGQNSGPDLTSAAFETGTRQFGSYHGGNIDTINLSTGGLTVDIPLISYPQRGGKLGLSFVLHYQNLPWFNFQSCTPGGGAEGNVPVCITEGPPQYEHSFQLIETRASLGGAGLVVINPSAPNLSAQAQMGPHCQQFVLGSGGSTYTCTPLVVEADGATHPLVPTSTTSYEAADGSGFRMDFSLSQILANANNASVVVTDANGTRYTLSTSTSFPVAAVITEDTNGNQIIASGSSVLPSITSRTDTAGRVIPNAFTSSDNAGCSGPLPIISASLWSPPGINGGTYPIKFCYVAIPETLPVALNTSPQSYSASQLQSIVLPNGDTWTFQYTSDGKGDLAQITFPTGGTLSYTWTNGPLPSQGSFPRAIQTRTLDPGNGDPVEDWKYSYAGQALINKGELTTTVTDAQGNDTTHVFSPNSVLGNFQVRLSQEVQTQFFKGSAGSGTLLKTIQYDYQNTDVQTKSGAIVPLPNQVPIRVTTTWANGRTSKVEHDYDSGFSISCFLAGSYDTNGNPSGNCSGTFGTAIYGRVVTTREFDFGNSAPGPLIRTTATSYQAFSNASYLNNNLLTLPSAVSITDGANNQAAITTYGYDETALASSGVSQHDASPPASTERGNLTSVNRSLNTTGGQVTTSNKWFDSGELSQQTDAGDANGKRHTTTYTYDSTGTYPAQVCNALQQCVTRGYDTTTGLLTSQKDANGNTSTYSYDSMWRVTKVQLPPDPAGNMPATTFQYPDANTVQRFQSVTSGLTDEVDSHSDGLGRPSTSVHVTAGDSTVATFYDSMGRVAAASNPYVPGGGPTAGVTETQYDPLGRAVQTTKQDGSVSTIAYEQTAVVSSNTECTLVTDEAGNPRQTCVDGLGRLVEVDEPAAGSGSPGAAATGSGGITGSEQTTQVVATPAVPGSGSVTVGGGPAQWKTVSSSATTTTGGTTAITISGAEQQWPVGNTPGTGSVTFSGTEQVIPATTAGGSVTVNGALQWVATGTVTIVGSEQSKSGVGAASGAATVAIGGPGVQSTTDCCGNPLSDSGQVWITVNGNDQESISYDNGYVGCTASHQSGWDLNPPTVAKYLANCITASSPNITASVSGGTVSIKAKSQGTNTNYSLSAGSSYNTGGYTDPNTGAFISYFTQPSFTASASGSALTGGNNGSTVYDSGTCTVTVNGSSYSTSFGQGDTPSSIASRLASAVSAGNLVSVSASGAMIFLVSKQAGSNGAYSLSSSCSYNSSTFSSASFNASASGSTLTGGTSAIYDSGTCTVTANSHGDSTSAWSGSGTTAASIASSLASAISNDSSASVSATASGATVSLKAKTTGAVGNYALASSCSYDTGHFKSASFSTSNSGAALSGGKNAIYDAGTITIAVNSHSDSYSFGQNDTPSTIATGLAGVINKDTGASVTATASGAAVSLTATTTGGISNYSLGAPQVSFDNKDFSQASFSVAAPSALAGGAPPAIFTDSGTMTVTVNSTKYAVSWSTNDTAGSIASNLVSAISGDATVTPALRGGTVYLNPKQAASAYSSSTTFAFDTAHTGHFTQSSFTPANQISDYGTATVTVNGHSDSASWAGLDTPSSIAAMLSSAINADASAPVSATAAISSSVVSLTARTGGLNTDYTLSSAVNFDTKDFSTASFNSNNSGAALTGGANTVFKTVYDAGTVSLTVGGFTATAPYQQGSTPASVAASLASALNQPSSPVAAFVSGSGVAIAALDPGTAGNYPLSWGASSSQSSLFSQASFGVSLSGSTLSGGANPTPPSLSSSMPTLYIYDALGNLTCVEQHGSASGTGCSSAPSSDAGSPWRVRRFSYDSLSRLLTASNPESGTISYSYDPDGNMLQKTSSAPNQTGSATQTISYCYDPLHRVTGKAYSAQNCPLSSPVVTYVYDSGTNGIGHLTSLNDQVGSGSYNYDALGRITSEQRTIASITKSLSYTYNLNNSIATLTHPSGAVLTYTPDSAGRMLSAVDQGNSINYITGASYAPDNSVAGFISGNTITSSFSYNNRLQPARMAAASPTQTVFSLEYNFHLGAGDNGNVWGIANGRDTTRNQTFTYDALNRLTSAQNAGTDCTQKAVNGGTKFWGNSYGYDPWGNLTQKTPTQCSSENLSVVALNNNQLSGYSYDAAGNMTHDATTGNNYSYDPENRITGAAGFAYSYDADGNRVEKSNGSTGTIYWYMSPGIVAESDLSGNLKAEYVFFNGDRVARKDFSGSTAAVSYYFSDHLKTAEVITDSAGNIKAESDYYPWGGELPLINNDSNHYKFTGQERDNESGLDLMGIRSYASWLGRFVQTDPEQASGFENKGDPQSWNAYTYARNNPLKYVDPTGESYRVCDEHGQNCSNQSDSQFDQNKADAQKAGEVWKDGKIYVSDDSGNLQLKGTYQQTDTDSPGATALFQGNADLWHNANGFGDTLSRILFVNPPRSWLCPEGVSCAMVFPTGMAVEEFGVSGFVRPVATDQRLQNIINHLFQDTDVVPGGTAGAVRFEKATGNLLSPKGHVQDAADMARHLGNFLRDHPGLSTHDQNLTKHLIQDLQNATAGKP